jgi:CRP/FNR family transcriptional regulator, cyclic AMP receptor protein
MAEDTQLYQKFGRTVRPGEIVFQEGDTGDQMFIIQEGKVKVTKSLSGREHVLSTLGKGDFFGEMAIVNNVRRTATVTAVSEVQLLAFNREGFLSMVTKNAKIALNIIDKLCRRLQNMNTQIQQLLRNNPRGLVALNLNYAFKGAEGGVIATDRAIEEIAMNLQVPIDSVKSVIEKLTADGVIAVQGNQLMLVDATRLATESEK